jgi:transcriptional regulator of acetoin/glycerol metabolism
MQSLFFSTPADRLALVRQRYFEEGELPSGAVSDAVYQSWARCQRQKQDPFGKIEFQPVSASRAQLALQKNHLLRDAWLAEAAEINAVLGVTLCGAILTDASGVLIGATETKRTHEKITPVAHRIGVNFSEEALGTTAPGIVARTGKAVCVQGGEHYFASVSAMHCAAAPIRDIHGNLAGVLNLSSEDRVFNFDVATVVGLYANSIENRLLLSRSNDYLVVRFQISPALLDTPMAGLMGVDTQGNIVWKNAVAERLLGTLASGDKTAALAVDDALQSSFAKLASLRLRDHALLRLSNGLQVYARCQWHARDMRYPVVALGMPAPAVSAKDASLEAAASLRSYTATDANPASSEPLAPGVPSQPASLRDADVDLIAKTLKACAGNVSAAARKLRVSRGLIYRRIQGA